MKVGEELASILGSAAGAAIGVLLAGLIAGSLSLPAWGAVVIVGLFAYGGSEPAKWLFGEAAEIAESLSELFSQGKLYVPRRDPLVLDLDGDGIETVGMNAAAPIFFDHDADGIRTGTGWVHPDDGFLVLDRNSNGRVDDGRELFGDATPLNGNGTLDPSAGDRCRWVRSAHTRRHE